MTAAQALGTLTNNLFYGTTCVSPSNCWAVGAYAAEAGQTLIEHWDGTAWTIVNSPNTSATETNVLAGVTCRSSSDCWAVGGFYTADGSSLYTLTEHWDGNSWTIVSSPNPDGSHFSAFNSVTCTSSGCWAVGFSYGNTFHNLIARWNGSSWVLVAAPNTDPAQPNALLGVACSSDSDCSAVGNFATDTAVQTLTEHWNGSTWAIVASPNVDGAQSILSGVACTSTSECWAVGYYIVYLSNVGPAGATLAFQTLIEKWDGTSWSISPAVGLLPQDNALFNVTCASSTDCWTVGNTRAKTPPTGAAEFTTLIEHWNGIAWAPVPSPNTSLTQNNGLQAVTCATASNCWAVGTHSQGFFQQTLAERWDGSSWTIVPSQNRPPVLAFNLLTAVTCVTSAECWAVGYYTNDDLINQTVTEHWNGSSWTLVPSANTSSQDRNYLRAVNCVSVSDCWAVGSYSQPGKNSQTLAEHWDGSAWTVFSTPNVGTTNTNELNSVVCLSTSDCWAVGYGYMDDSANQLGQAQALIVHWDGTSWSSAHAPNGNANQNNILSGVSCVSASDCWAAGQFVTVSGALQTLTEHWDGNSWTIIPSPNFDDNGRDSLAGVSCLSSFECWAAGSYHDANGIERTLIERWDGNSWSIVNSPSPSGGYNFFNGITCASSSECWTVGEYWNEVVRQAQTLIQRWDGNAWTIVPSPNPSSSNTLFGVACSSTSDCWAVGFYFKSGVAQPLTEHYIAPVSLTGVVSRKLHGNTATYDVDLTSDGIECRSGGSNGDYTLVFTFANGLTSVDSASVSGGVGSVSDNGIGSDTHQYIVQLTGVTNAQRLNITLNHVRDASGAATDALAVTVPILIGDTNGDGVVNSSDIAQTKSQSGQSLTSSNFREDMTADGALNSADIALTKSKSGTGLP